ncbi:Exo-beta-D-glucosaminidase [Paenibacillus allorhizoplanae]|uniref:beta-mannosidase n=1 Tax=Paenibacillus allorhizoplanae TaxID=2905648 RepID=A0ABN8G1A0_9BACL|nr:sugar-binding domain-containing protein [Paenibacillus allorhizoplanae]CAH1192523.1 Exo-beta-D-glucosaminidase [Paenibacillus allorhizoplanae]
MEVKRISLNGSDWLYKDFLGEDWIWRNAEKPQTKDYRWWRQGTVPGTVLHDLWQNGEVSDPYFERNSLLAEWVPERTWIYKKTFNIDASLLGRHIQLHFKGVDYEAQFFLNGNKLGHHKGMFTAAVFDVTDTLHYGGENLLSVVIEKAPDEQPQVSKTSYVREHKSRMTYWWDFCPRMIHQGIWDDVYLDVTGPIRIEDIYVRSQLSEEYRQADLTITSTFSTGNPTEIRLETRILSGDEMISSESNYHFVNKGETVLTSSVILSQPRLWQPNGSGKAHLYQVQLHIYEKVLDEHGKVSYQLSSSKETVCGIREVDWQRNDTPDPTARPYVLLVNGHKTYIKGWNWVPMDVMYGREQSAKLERLLMLAKQAGVNMLRVWGGGLIEKDAFYELCNRYGIMVWQEFIQSSSGIANKPSEDEGFIAMMVKEAEHIIPRKRNHPSLVLWCGGNELQDLENRPLDDEEPVLEALRKVVEALHPDSLWLPTSPTGRCFENSLINIEQDPTGQHDVHGPWEFQGLSKQYELYNKGTSLLHSEFGVEGMTHHKTLQHTISESKQWPATRDNPVYFHRGSWWINEPMIQSSFGHQLSEPAELIRASQLLQAEGLRYAVESNLRRMWQNSGTLPWQFNEPYPNAYCTSALDYFTIPKPVYYAVARAYQSIQVSASFARIAWGEQETFNADIWAVQTDRGRLDGLTSHWSLVGASGKVYAEAVWHGEVEANSAKWLGTMELPMKELHEDVFFLRISLMNDANEVICQNGYPFSGTANLVPLLSMQETAIRVEKVNLESGALWQLTITNIGTQAAFHTHLEDSRPILAEGFVYYSDNDFHLLPGKSKQIQVQWSAVKESERHLELSAWNSPIQHLFN